MNLANVQQLRLTSIEGTWYRAIEPQFYRTALQTGHTRNLPSRFNPGRGEFEMLYLAETPDIALFEVGALLGSPFSDLGALRVADPRRSWIMISVRVRLFGLVELALTAEQAKLSTDAQTLTGDWLGYVHRKPSDSVSEPVGVAPTQQLGAALWAHPEIEGFTSISARVPNWRILAVFPQKLRTWSEVVFHNPMVTGKINTLVHGEVIPPP